jgi:hypothetical protein
MLHARTTSCGAAMLSCFLNRRARNVAIGAEHAAIPRLWLEEGAAAPAFVEELTSVSRHHFR